MSEEIHELLDKYFQSNLIGERQETILEISRRLKAFDWYNQHYHLPDELKHLEKGVSLKERKLKG